MSLVALDLDGTLVDQADAAREWGSEFVAKWNLPTSAIGDIAATLSERRPKGDIFNSIAASWSLPISGADLWSDYRRRMPELVRCSDEDKQALRDLRSAGWTLGIVTNGMADNQEGKIRATGLASLVDGWVISDQIGHRKPEPAIFHALAARLECDLHGWMIGDSVEHDIAGGTAVGLRTVLITASAQVPDHAEATPVLTAPTVTAAAAAILSEMYH
jgi:HAD superfamily hydrolase (TIGR01549 family)